MCPQLCNEAVISKSNQLLHKKKNNNNINKNRVELNRLSFFYFFFNIYSIFLAELKYADRDFKWLADLCVVKIERRKIDRAETNLIQLNWIQLMN